MVVDFMRYLTETEPQYFIVADLTRYLNVADFMRYYTRITFSFGCRFHKISHHSQKIGYPKIITNDDADDDDDDDGDDDDDDDDDDDENYDTDQCHSSDVRRTGVKN